MAPCLLDAENFNSFDHQSNFSFCLWPSYVVVFLEILAAKNQSFFLYKCEGKYIDS